MESGVTVETFATTPFDNQLLRADYFIVFIQDAYIIKSLGSGTRNTNRLSNSDNGCLLFPILYFPTHWPFESYSCRVSTIRTEY